MNIAMITAPSCFARITLASLSLFSLASAQASASIITESFDKPSSLNNWWKSRDSAWVEVQAMSSGSSNALFMGRRSTGGTSTDSGVITYKNLKLANFSASVTVNIESMAATGNFTFGYTIRAASAEFTSGGGYYVAYDKQNSRLAIFDSPTGHTAYGTLLQSTSVTLQTGVDYIFKVLVDGKNIEASIWEDAAQVASVSISNAANVSGGLFGLRVGAGNAGNIVTFRNLSVDAIPEPSSVAFSVIGLGVGAFAFRKRLNRGR